MPPRKAALQDRQREGCGFSQLKELISDQGEVAFILAVDDLRQESVYIKAYAPLHHVDVGKAAAQDMRSK
jgi:hypothetical protein